jgi:hypothetical protein
MPETKYHTVIQECPNCGNEKEIVWDGIEFGDTCLECNTSFQTQPVREDDKLIGANTIASE